MALLAFSISPNLLAQPLEVIVVTAQKRETLLQQTPVAITAINRETIETRNLDDFAQVQFLAPALVFSEVADMAQITIRGVGMDITTMDAEPGAAMHADGIYRGGLPSSGSLFFDVERLEIMRGPQGTLYGRNSTGGSINIISRLPGPERSFEAGLLLGNYDRKRVELSGDTPLVPGKAFLRSAVAFDMRDGYSTNRLTGADEDDAKSSFAKLSAVISPSSRVDITPRLEYLETELGGPPFLKTSDHPVPPFWLSLGNPAGILRMPGNLCGTPSCETALGLKLSRGGVGSSDPRNLFSDGTTRFWRESWGLSTTIDADLSDDLTLKSITAVFDIDHRSNQTNNDGVDIPYLSSKFDQDNREWSQEISLSGSSAKAEWIAGLYYYDSAIGENYHYTMPALQPTFEALFGLLMGTGGSLPPGSLAYFGTQLDGTSSALPFLDFGINQELSSGAVYGQMTYNLGDRLRGTLGARWTQDRKDLVQTVANNIGNPTCRNLALAGDWNKATGKLGLDFDLSAATFLYSSISTGFKAGGINGFECNNPYNQESLLAYEVGTKSTLLDGTLNFNVAAFYYDYTDLQARLFFNNASIVRNAADAVSYGLEFEWQWQLTGAFRLEGSVALLGSEFRDFHTTDPLNPHVGVGCNALTKLECLQDLTGNKLLRAPDTKAALTAEYAFASGGLGQLTLRGEFSYTDAMHHSVFNNDFAMQDDYALSNVRLVWRPAGSSGERLGITAFVENVGDEAYVMTHVPNATTGGTISTFGPPRLWGVQIRYKL